ncbi:phosphoadenosine phosphosulfate reductase [Profundibacterium mesophilum]|uniref:Phosphoadenosine phosphosulfate reductase n=1 Tax=Profundibacterium mesophilum KAUST100406-0324 TaxID=1037889 RepID=A0A921P087_9RHOB|nr:phosphoadenosine phosphosulfate reductase [Profundibacterium mesophilum]KAF0676808.1 hypothetical protein PMES_00895 [Profundibacterium mesophilum KAUST100406-0324]
MTPMQNALIEDRELPEEAEFDDDEMDSSDVEDFAYDLNPRHHVRFQRRGPALLVSFEAAREPGVVLSERAPRLDGLARDLDWSILSLVSRGDTWFRDPEVITFFDALADGTLLDQFETVLFYGDSSGGHAALSFALAAPCSRVLALAPQAFLDAQETAWDTRFKSSGKVDFTSRYTPDAANLSASLQVFVPHDPMHAEDARHMALLAGPTVTALNCRHMGSRLEATLAEFGILEDVVCEAMEGTLDAVRFYELLRARRQNASYLRRVVSRCIEKRHRLLEALAVRNIAQRLGRNRYAKRFDQLSAELAQAGQPVPPQRGS